KNEFTKTFNGIALDISEKEANEIKKISGVKNVYPNFKVQANLMDSVPAINADDVWQLDSQGNKCIESGNECLTGKNATIAIIDTGIDYTHPDLGGNYVNSGLNEREFKKINANPLVLSMGSAEDELIDQQISLNNNRLAYYSENKIYIYSFETNQTREISPPVDSKIFKLYLKDNLIIYFAEDLKTSYTNLYLYDLNTKNQELIKSDIYRMGSLYIYFPWVVYGDEEPYLDATYSYNILTHETNVVFGPESSTGVVLFSGSENVVIQSTGDHEKFSIYNLETMEKVDISPPNSGPIMDFKNNKILYSEYNKENPDWDWKSYYLYDLKTGNYTLLGNISSEVQALARDVYYNNEGSIGEGVVYFSKNYDANKIMAYDLNLERYVQINLYIESGDIDAEGNKICFISNKFNVYCHDYNSSYDYPVPDNVFTDKVIGGYDFVNLDNDPMDDQGHGTHCAGIAAGKSQGEIIDNYHYKEGDYVGIGEYILLDGYPDYVIEISDIQIYEEHVILRIRELYDQDAESVYLSKQGDFAYFNDGALYIKADLLSKKVSFTFGGGSYYDNPGEEISELEINITRSIGLNGVAPDAKLYAYKVLNAGGSGSFASVLSAVDMAVDPNNDSNFSDHVDIMSMSFGAEGYYWCYDDDLTKAFINAINLGSTIVVAAGNEGPNKNTISYPSCIQEVITVGSSDRGTSPSSFSSRGFGLYNGEPILKPDILAPGSDICSAQYGSAWNNYKCYDDKHIAISGTSMATPHVAGAAALIKQAYPNTSVEEIKSLLMNHADVYSIPLINTKLDYGAGGINVLDSFKNFKDNEVIVVPGSLSLGVFDLSKDVWKSSKPIKIINKKDSISSLIIYADTNFPEGITFNYPSEIQVSPNSETIFYFNVSVENYVEDNDYTGSIMIINNEDIIKIPFFFKKMHLEVKTNKNLTNSDVKISVHSDIPIIIENSQIIGPDLQENLELDYRDIQNFKGNFEPKISGKYTIQIEAQDYQGNKLYGQSSFIADLDFPELNLTIKNNTLSLVSNEALDSVFLEEQLTDTVFNQDNLVEESTLEEDNENVYINYIWRGPIGFDTPFILYNSRYNKTIGRIEETKEVVNGPELFTNLQNQIGRSNLGLTVFFYQEPLLIKDSKENIFTVFGYETNNVFCGVNGIGLRKLNKISNQWELVNDNLNTIDRCINDANICADAANYPEYHCDIWNGRFENNILNIKAEIDSEDNINLIWSETFGGEIIDGKIINKYKIYYKKIDEFGNTLIEKTPIIDLLNPNKLSPYDHYFDFKIDNEDKLNFIWSEQTGEESNYESRYKYLQDNSWSNEILIGDGSTVLFNLLISFNNTLCMTYTDNSQEEGSLYYGCLNSNNILEQIRLIKSDGWWNMENSLDKDTFGNLFIAHQEAFYNPGAKLALYYSIYRAKTNLWEKGLISDTKADFNEISDSGVKMDILGNSYTTYLNNLDHTLDVWNTYDLFFNRLTGTPTAIITSPDSSQEIVQLEKFGTEWKANFSLISEGDYSIEVYATDPAGNMAHKTTDFLNGRSRSKLVNRANNILTGNLTLELQKELGGDLAGSWIGQQIVVNQQLTIPALSSVDISEYWNNENVSASSAGNYRIYGKFEVGNEFKEYSWEFSVGEESGNVSICGDGKCKDDETSLNCPIDCNNSIILCYNNSDCPSKYYYSCGGDTSMYLRDDF
ncbi:MAG: S8 family serine peptidase, partial [Candidatus Nanoarchaeia archaeon]